MTPNLDVLIAFYILGTLDQPWFKWYIMLQGPIEKHTKDTEEELIEAFKAYYHLSIQPSVTSVDMWFHLTFRNIARTVAIICIGSHP